MHPMRFSIRSLTCLLLSAAFLARGQDPKPADPFIKTQAGAKSEAKATAKSAAPASGLPSPASGLDAPASGPAYPCFIFETYTLPKDALDSLHAESPAAEQFYDRIRKLTEAGQAILDTVTALPTKSGQRATNESVDEVLYPTQFDPPVEGRPYSFPTAYESRMVGERIEIDPVVSESGKRMDLNLAPEITKFMGFVEQKSGALQGSAGGELQPLFTTRKLTASVGCTVGVPLLLGTQSRPGATGLSEVDALADKVSVTFLTARMVTVSPGPKHDAPDRANLRMIFRFYSLPRAKAHELLTSTADADALQGQVAALPKESVKLERLLTLHTRSGQRMTLEETAENLYSTEFQSPRMPIVREAIPEVKTAAGTTPAVPAVYASGKPVLPGATTSLEMRPLGWRIEIDPVVAPDGSVVDLNFFVEHTENRGPLQGPPLLDRYPPRPVFSSQRITTSITATPGKQCFLGTLNPPHDTGVNGRKDDGLVWFGFVKVTLESE